MTAPADARRSAAGFTLIEVIGAFMVMTVVLILIFGMFRENTRQRQAASELLRVETTAAGALDLVAQDLEAAVYVSRPQGRDPSDHPWVFRAEGAGELGATRLRFQTQNVSRGNLGENASTWVDVVYFLTEEEWPEDEEAAQDASRYTLWRWRSSRPPGEATDRVPDETDPRSARVAEGLAAFGVQFSDLDGETSDEWDSTYAVEDAPLPITAEIKLALYRRAREGEAAPGVLEIPGRVHERALTLAMHQPIDVAQLVSLASSENEAVCATIADCADIDDEWFVDLRENQCDGDEDLCALLNASTETCWSAFAGEFPSVAASAPAACEDLE